MKFIIPTTIVVALFVYYFKENLYPYITTISGTVEIKEEFIQDLKTNSMLYITLHNDKGIIFAVKQVINPQFPLKFKITTKNILYPEIVTIKCSIKAVLNYHGNLHERKVGDIYSDDIKTIIINPNIKIILNKKEL